MNIKSVANQILAAKYRRSKGPWMVWFPKKSPKYVSGPIQTKGELQAFGSWLASESGGRYWHNTVFENYRKVLYTGKHSQLVLMTLKPNEEIGMEVHQDNDQFFRFEKGSGKVIIDGNEYQVSDGFAVIVPAGAQHNVVNVSGTDELKLYTIYSPAHHQDGVLRETKAEAEANSPEFDGKTTE